MKWREGLHLAIRAGTGADFSTGTVRRQPAFSSLEAASSPPGKLNAGTPSALARPHPFTQSPKSTAAAACTTIVGPKVVMCRRVPLWCAVICAALRVSVSTVEWASAASTTW